MDSSLQFNNFKIKYGKAMRENSPIWLMLVFMGILFFNVAALWMVAVLLINGITQIGWFFGGIVWMVISIICTYEVIAISTMQILSRNNKFLNYQFKNHDKRIIDINHI